MTTIDQIKSLQAKLSKEVTDLKKKRDASKATAEKASAEFQKLDAQVKAYEEAMGGSPSAPAVKAAAKATPTTATAAPVVRLKKDGTPKKKPGPSKTAKAAPSAPAAKAAATAAPVVRLKKDGTPKKKPGPSKKAAAPVAKAAAKAEPKKAAKAVAEPKKAAKQKSRAAEGRRAVLAGERPTLKDAMKTVMGKATMNSQEVYDLLKAKGWLPNSTEPKNYIGYSLSTLKDHFERVADKGRGFYRVKGVTGNASQNNRSEPIDQTMSDAAAILGIN